MRDLGLRALPVVLFAAYAALLLFDLERFPAINLDEPGYAEPAWTLITRGEFGAPMYTGMFGIEHRVYTNSPGRGVTTVLPYLLLGPTLVAARLASDRLSDGRRARQMVGVIIVVTITLNTASIASAWTSTPRSRNDVVEALHDAIPVGARVLIPFREWYTFVNRNPAIGLEGRSLPMFGTSLARSADEFGVEYVVMIRSALGMKPFYWVEASDPLVQAVTAQEMVGSGVQIIRGTHPGEEFVIVDVAQGQADVGVVTARQ